MWGKRFTAEKIINMLREAEVLLGAGEVWCELNISEQTYYGWRKEYRGMYIEPGSPWENGYIESFNGKMRDEVLSREVFDTILGARKWLWSDGDENIIIYDHIAHRGIDLLLQRSLFQWERRCSAPPHTYASETNSQSGTKYGGWSLLHHHEE